MTRILPTPVMDRLDREEIRALYESGLTQIEIAARLGVASATIARAMKKFGIRARPAIPRTLPRGPLSVCWIGDKAKYNACHSRVVALYGTPKRCSRCGTEDESQHYDWANLTGRYEDTNDYARMCRRCHFRYDADRRRAEGKLAPLPTCKKCGSELPLGTRRRARANGGAHCKRCFQEGVRSGELGRWSHRRRGTAA
jgi:hypothetical protein